MTTIQLTFHERRKQTNKQERKTGICQWAHICIISTAGNPTQFICNPLVYQSFRFEADTAYRLEHNLISLFYS